MFHTHHTSETVRFPSQWLPTLSQSRKHRVHEAFCEIHQRTALKISWEPNLISQNLHLWVLGQIRENQQERRLS